MSDVIKYPLSAAIELCEQLDNDETNYRLKMLEYKRERDEAREALASREVVIAQQEVITNLILERDEARDALKEWQTLCLWGGTPEHIHDFIKGQQTRIHEAQDIEKTCELLASEKTTRNHIIKRSVEVEQERDEAREEIKRLKVILDLIKKDTI